MVLASPNDSQNFPARVPSNIWFRNVTTTKYSCSCAISQTTDHICNQKVLPSSSVTMTVHPPTWTSFFPLLPRSSFSSCPQGTTSVLFLFFTLQWWPHLLPRLQPPLLRGSLPILYLHFWPLYQATAPHCQLPAKQFHLGSPTNFSFFKTWPERERQTHTHMEKDGGRGVRGRVKRASHQAQDSTVGHVGVKHL